LCRQVRVGRGSQQARVLMEVPMRKTKEKKSDAGLKYKVQIDAA
jgi:hypothetical protein